MELGAQSVTMDGQLFKLVWCVDSWDILMMVLKLYAHSLPSCHIIKRLRCTYKTKLKRSTFCSIELPIFKGFSCFEDS